MWAFEGVHLCMFFLLQLHGPPWNIVCIEFVCWEFQWAVECAGLVNFIGPLQGPTGCDSLYSFCLVNLGILQAPDQRGGERFVERSPT